MAKDLALVDEDFLVVVGTGVTIQQDILDSRTKNGQILGQKEGAEN